MNKAPKLTPTSFALLGLLDREPRSAYELNSLMQTSLIRVFWPRAESHVYSEPKKLLAHGLVSEESGTANGRKRTVYTITTSGRDALTDWLVEEGDALLRMQSEFMLKLILANSGNAENAQNTLGRSLQSSEQDLREAIDGIHQILDHDVAKEGMPWNGVAINLMADLLIARYEWNHYALSEASHIETGGSEEHRVAQGQAAYQRALDKMCKALDS